MIYLVTKQQTLFELDGVTKITKEKAREIINGWSIIQADSETNGRDPHINDLLCFQFGNPEGTIQIIIDCITEKIEDYKDILENKYLIFQNAKFDLQFLYKHSIIPRKIYDTMIVEQFLYLGYPSSIISYSLASIAKKYLNIDIDKSIRGDIIWRGLDLDVIKYAANDVVYLYPIMQAQLKKCKKRSKNTIIGAKLECDAVPAVAYLEWSGIMLDETKWKAKMKNDEVALHNSLVELNNYAKKHPKLQKWCKIDRQGDLFNGFDLEPKWTVDWQKKEVAEVVKALGFNTKAISKTTKKESDSIMEKVLSSQKGIDDTFLKLYFDYQGKYKVITSFGQGHLNAINPITGRLHTVYKQLGAISGRMSCGSSKPNNDLAKYKQLPPKDCKYPNLQQLPKNEITRSCFVAPKGYKFISCDYSAQEGRVQGDIYQDEAILKMYREGIDGHSMYAKIFFKDELKDIDVHDVKKLRPDLRTKAKGPEFALAYGGSYTAIMSSLQCSEEEAKQIVANYKEGFKGTIEFAKKGSKFVRKNGYIVINPTTDHRMWWWDHDKWLERQKKFTLEFWDNYRTFHKGTGDEVALEVKKHFQDASDYDRLARNAPAQGTSSIMTKTAFTNIFNWIVDNGYFNKIHFCAAVHDELNYDYPEEVEEFPNVVKTMMEEAASKYCKSLPIPAEASVGDYWIH